MVPDPPQDKHEVDHFVYSFMDSQEDGCTKQNVEEQMDTPSIFLLDDIANVAYLPVCDENDRDYEVEFFPTACSPLENIPSQQYNEICQFTYHSCKKENSESAEGNSLPLCFSSFKFLKENSKVLIDGKESMLMPSHADSRGQTDKELQPSVEGEAENQYVQKFKDIEKGAYDSEEMLKS
jgi:hypothetical protein